MGVPKFYRFISDRYPCINKTVKEYEIPDYENLYLDMNSIIHTCSHPSDSDVHFRIGKKELCDEDIYQNVCHYVEIIFSIVKPVDLMYLAFDGVAPRAKMNQQRAHRFRSSKGIDEAGMKNEVIQDTLFDANCITTGTVFMAELIDHVKHFVANKVSTDPAWQKCKIIVSGPEVPGEGEHKIMEYIRYSKAQPNYNQNTRHCLYSLDADLIVLGLCTHEPHFSLIREKVTFGKRMNMLTPEESDFDLLQLSLLREYLKYEFAPIESKLKFAFDLEKIIDDWVLIGFLVGNDFIPQLPNLNIVHGALPYLYRAYMKALPTLDGYINEGGELNVTRFKLYLRVLSELQANSSKSCKVPEFLATVSENNSSEGEIETEVPDDDTKETEALVIGETTNDNDNSKVEILDDNELIKHLKNEGSENSDSEEDSENTRQLIENAFKALDLKCDTNKVDSRDNDGVSLILSNVFDESMDNILLEGLNTNICMEDYYKNKLKFDQIDSAGILAIVEQYIKAVQWTLRYYYQGCCSWSWYYPYHYAPLITDFDKLHNIEFDFNMSTPFLPLQHLLAVLPPANVHLLPKPLQSLLTNQKSPIIDFYPKDFEVDLNGKTNDWESIVLIPFIDENKLIKAMEPYMKCLNFKERNRNRNGLTSTYTYTKTSLGQYPVETIFGSFENHAQLKHIETKDMHIPKEKLVPGLCNNVSFNLSFPGFPTLKHVPHSFSFAQTQSKFNTHIPTKIERMMLHVSPKLANELEDLAKDFLGQEAYAYWPYLHEVHIIGVTDFKKKIMLKNFWKGYSEDNVKNIELSKHDIQNLHDETKSITDTYKDTFGIEIGETQILFYIFPLIGKKYACANNGNVQLQKKWSQSYKLFPYQLLVNNEKIRRYNFILYESIDDLFISASTCFMIDQPHYGTKGKIKSIVARHQLISVTLELPLEPDFSSSTEQYFIANNTYLSCNEVAKKLNVSATLINRITGSLILTEESTKSKYHDIGLRMKFPKHDKELFGYTKKERKFWAYSEKAILLIQNYMTEFPHIFEFLNKNIKSSTLKVSDVFPDGLAQLNAAKVWLSEQKVHYTTFLECHTRTLGLNGVPALEKYVEDFYSQNHEQKTISKQVKAQSLFVPGILTGLVPPDFKAENKLLDRIICVKNNFTVPLGFKGTIIGIQEKAEKHKDVYEVLFDSPFTGGLTLYESSEHKCYRLMATDFINISFGQRDSQNSRPPRANAPLNVSRNIDNKRNHPKQETLNNAKVPKNYENRSNNSKHENMNDFKVNNRNDNRPNNREKLFRTGSEIKINCKNGYQKACNPPTDSKESNGCNENKPSTSGNQMQSQETDGDETKKWKVHHNKRQRKTKPTRSRLPVDENNCAKETEHGDEKLNEKSVPKNSQHNTGTRPKAQFNKKKNNENNDAQKTENEGEKSNGKPAFKNPQYKNTGTRPKVPFNKNNGSENNCARATDNVDEKLNDKQVFKNQQHKYTGTRPKAPFNKNNGSGYNFAQANENVDEKLNGKPAFKNPQHKNTGTRPKAPYNKKNVNENGCVQSTENVGENLNNKPTFKNPEHKNTGTRPKTPFNKNNGGKFQGRANQQPRGMKSKKNSTFETNNPEKCEASNALHTSNADGKSVNPKEDN